MVNNENPYVLDYIEDTEHAALTEKNKNFIEAVVKLDSNYKRDLDVNAEGGIAWLFNELKQNYNEEMLSKVIETIDNTNSTHLNAKKEEGGEDARIRMCTIISENCSDIEQLKAALREDINSDNHLMNKLLVKINNRVNLSFASKFCAYASSNLLDNEDLYPKYDNVVSKWLYVYVKEYLGIDRPKKYYQKGDDKFELYKKYYTDIKRIIDEYNLKEKGIGFNEFDHILWYTHKGK